MNNLLIIIIGWIVFLSIVGYIVAFIVKEFVAMVKSEATLYKRTKSYKTRIEARRNEVLAMALNTVVHDYWNVRKAHPDCETWCIDQWYDYYAKQSEKGKEEKHEQ